MLNIFFLDKNPILAVRYTYDIHLIKEILEIVQILSLVRKRIGLSYNARYTPRRHINHPIVIWAMLDINRYIYVDNLLHLLNYEFCFRYQHNREHKSFAEFKELTKDDSIDDMRNAFSNMYLMHKDKSVKRETECGRLHNHSSLIFPTFLPSSYRIFQNIDNVQQVDPENSYRHYYYAFKRFSLPRIGWKRRSTPYWFNDDYFKSKSISLYMLDDSEIKAIREKVKRSRYKVNKKKI